MSLLSVENLSVRFRTNDGDVKAVNDVSFDIQAGQKLAIVGESGSGKSQIAFSIMGLLARNGAATGSINFDGQEILNIKERELNKIRAKKMSIIFQDPMSSLNPYMRIQDQMAEVLTLHEGMTKSDAIVRATQLLDAVQIPDAKNRIGMFPHEFSGGMRQRIVIAMALLCNPKLIIADEPTTALDVTIQAQIMKLLADIQKDFNTAVMLITHDLGVVAGFCEEVLVLYGGRVMERAKTIDVFETPSHPYTKGLLNAIPRIHSGVTRLEAIPGNPPNMLHPPAGCPFAPRCRDKMDQCEIECPLLTNEAPIRACFKPVGELS